MRYLDPETMPRGADGGRGRYQPYRGHDRDTRDTRPRSFRDSYRPQSRRSRSPPRTGADSNDWRKAAREEPKFAKETERVVPRASPERREERADRDEREMSMEIDDDD
jgi:hypothetical protein